MTWRWLPRLVALLAVAVAVSTVLSWVALSKISEQADRIEAQANRVEAQARANAIASRALCALRANLKRRGDQANDFHHENPNGTGGITDAVIVKSIRDTRGTLRALHNLKC